MPKKKKEESQEEQSRRFKRFAEDMISAGELNPTEAEAGLEGILEKIEEKQKDK